MISSSKLWDMKRISRLSQYFFISQIKHTDIRSIVAVHDIAAHSKRTWTMQKREEKWMNWLENADMLSRKLRNARIMRFEYKSEWFESQEIEIKNTRVRDVSAMLLDKLKRFRKTS